jgi:hypothetical protein
MGKAMVVCFTTAVQLSFYSILKFSDWVSFQLLEFQKDSEATNAVLGINGADSKPEIQSNFMECYVTPFCKRHPGTHSLLILLSSSCLLLSQTATAHFSKENSPHC